MTQYQTAAIYRGLRQQVTEFDPVQAGFVPSDRVWGILMEVGLQDAVFTLVAIIDGTVSLYFSNGGGIIGSGQHEAPRKAGEALLKLAPQFLHHAQPTTTFPLPRSGYARFHFLTFDGHFTAEAKEDDLTNNQHPLSPLFFAGNDVLTRIRLVDEGWKELIPAAANGDRARVDELLEMGVDVNAADETGLTALMAASHTGETDVVNVLLQAQSTVDKQDAEGYTALMFACNAGNQDCVRALINHGAQVNLLDNTGSTPLMFAAQHGYTDIVRLLLEHGADKTIVGEHGLSALGFARQNGHQETERLLQ
ncbi:MAG TPA: ankyrin repeat domain-containing protein [Oceanobacillus sp.]|nr:ankyrin repeat domain-containing protein [Oceanobacillus sp.]